MPQFAVYANPRPSVERAPFLVNLQSDFFDFSTCVVAPLVKPSYFGSPIERLNPRLTVQDETFILSPSEMTASLLRDLGPSVDDLGHRRDDIVAAIDMLFTGI